MAKNKRVVASWDYLDGIQGLSIHERVESYNSYYRSVPVELLARLQAAHDEVHKLEQEIMSLPEVQNRKYDPDA